MWPNAAAAQAQVPPPPSGQAEQSTSTPEAAVSPQPVAQTAPPEASTGDMSEAVIVTGSRLPTGFSQPTPVTTVGAQQIERQAAATLGEVLAQIPSVARIDSPNTAGVTSRSGGQINPDLRNLGSSRTLVLVDGRRHVPTASNGTVDIKVVPTLLVNQVEVVTGGASAAYGSDAVSGVVNFILKKKIEGIQGTVSGGISNDGDGEEFRASLAVGPTFAGGRGHLVAGVDFLNIAGINTQLTRDWGRREVGLITNPNFATNGLPNFIISPNVHSANTTPGGLIVSGPLRGTAFGPNGTTYTYHFGQVFGSSMIGGDGQFDNENLGALLGSPLTSVNSLAHASFEVSPKFEVFAELSSSYSKVLGASQENRDRGNLVIRRDNAFLPDSVRAAMVANNLQTITIGRVSYDIGKIKLDRRNKLWRGVAGAKGQIGGGWEWDAYYQYGNNDYSVDFGPNNRRQNEYAQAVDAVRNASGQIVCRSVAANPGCIPVNVFGNGSLQLNPYVFGTAEFDLKTKQHVVAANINGKPFSTWAGPVSFGVGAEYRKDTADATSDPLSQRINPNGSVGGWILGNQLPFSGKIGVTELYAETLVPLAEDIPFARELNISAAGRRTDYSTSGVVYTWKLGSTWRPFEGVRFRITRSRDIRAPNMSELYESGGSSNTNVFDPALGAAVQVREINAANPNLKPEKANTLTGGVVFQPSFVPRLALSLDYYNIKIKDVIATLGAPTLAQGCFAGNPLYCESITFNPDGTIAFITNTRLNLAAFKTSGLDMEAHYSFEPGFTPGRFDLRALATYVDHLTFITPNGPQERVGQVSNVNRTGGVPHWLATSELNYEQGHWGAGVRAKYIGKGKFSSLYHEGAGAVNTVNDNSVPSYLYINLNGHYRVDLPSGRTADFFATVNNLFDKDPPMIPSGAAGGINESSTNGEIYDVVGRFYRAGVRVKF
ncbi:MAG: TonB-dependent receptor [Sphingomicrobium sp.]